MNSPISNSIALTKPAGNAATDLSFQHQEKGRLTAIAPTSIRLKHYNYVYWIAFCDHGKLSLKQLIQEYQLTFQRELSSYLELFLSDPNSLQEQGIKLFEQRKKQARTRLLTRLSDHEDVKVINAFLSACLTDIFSKSGNLQMRLDALNKAEQSNREKVLPVMIDKRFLLPTPVLTNSRCFIQETCASCGCLRLDQASYLLVEPKQNIRATKATTPIDSTAIKDGVVFLPVKKLSEICGVPGDTILRRVNQSTGNSQLKLHEVLSGNASRHSNSKSGAYQMAIAVRRYVKEQRLSLNSVIEAINLDDRQAIILEYRILAEKPVTFETLAEVLNISREGARKIELRCLEEICKSYRLNWENDSEILNRA